MRGGRLTWPPYALLSSLSTLAGCLALVGPLILIRNGAISGSLGELVWLTGGLLVWVFDIEGILRGQWRSMHWATPLHDRAMGLTILAVLLAGWKCGMASWKWSWTNLTGSVAQRLLDRDGDLLLVPQPSSARNLGGALILDGFGGDD